MAWSSRPAASRAVRRLRTTGCASACARSPTSTHRRSSRVDLDDDDAQLFGAGVAQAMAAAGAVEDDVARLHLELFAVERHPPAAGDHDVELLVVVAMGVEPDVRA